jgi:hypothetical protein
MQKSDGDNGGIDTQTQLFPRLLVVPLTRAKKR